MLTVSTTKTVNPGLWSDDLQSADLPVRAGTTKINIQSNQPLAQGLLKTFVPMVRQELASFITLYQAEHGKKSGKVLEGTVQAIRENTAIPEENRSTIGQENPDNAETSMACRNRGGDAVGPFYGHDCGGGAVGPFCASDGTGIRASALHDLSQSSLLTPPPETAVRG